MSGQNTPIVMAPTKRKAIPVARYPIFIASIPASRSLSHGWTKTLDPIGAVSQAESWLHCSMTLKAFEDRAASL